MIAIKSFMIAIINRIHAIISPAISERFAVDAGQASCNRSSGRLLFLRRFVAAEDIELDGVRFERRLPRSVAELYAQFAESAKLEKAIKANLKGLGYGA